MANIPLSARVKHAVSNGRISGTVWIFNTARFQVRLEIEPINGYRYDGDDENNETQTALDNGDYVAFESRVIVELDGAEIASDSLYGSVYERDNVKAFWTDHRDSDPMNRNCSIMRTARGENVAIGHYFPDMVSIAIKEAREHVARMQEKPRLRAA